MSVLCRAKSWTWWSLWAPFQLRIFQIWWFSTFRRHGEWEWRINLLSAIHQPFLTAITDGTCALLLYLILAATSCLSSTPVCDNLVLEGFSHLKTLWFCERSHPISHLLFIWIRDLHKKALNHTESTAGVSRLQKEGLGWILEEISPQKGQTGCPGQWGRVQKLVGVALGDII